MIPARVELFAADSTILGRLLLEQIQSKPAQGGDSPPHTPLEPGSGPHETVRPAPNAICSPLPSDRAPLGRRFGHSTASCLGNIGAQSFAYLEPLASIPPFPPTGALPTSSDRQTSPVRCSDSNGGSQIVRAPFRPSHNEPSPQPPWRVGRLEVAVTQAL